MSIGFRLFLGIVSAVLGPLLAAALLGSVLQAAGATDWPILVWLVLAPALYLAWLLSYLSLSALAFQLLGRLHPKPRRMVARGGRLTTQGAVLLMSYQQADLLRALPLATGLLRTPLLQKLVLLSYAPRVSVGRNVLILGLIYDPELTELGDRVIVGMGSAIAAHALVSRDGDVVFVSAPIRVAADVTIGGESRVGLGVTIGAGSVIEPGSVVAPFTSVPPGQVWGGSPARYLRLVREEAPAAVAPSATMVPAAGDARQRAAARRLIADALGLSPEDIRDSSTEADVPGWDSLGKLVIATLASERHGVSPKADEVFALRSVTDVERLLAGARADVADATIVALPDNPELLPLLDRADATRALEHRPAVLPAQHHGTVVIASTFTAEPLVPSLRLWARAFGVDASIEVAGFDQLETSLLSPTGGLRAAPAGAVRVVLVRGEELGAEPAARLARARGILDAIEGFTTEIGSLVVGSLPPALTPLSEGERSQLEALRSEWHGRLETISGVEILDVAGVVERLGTVAARSVVNEANSRMPWSAAACRDLGIEIGRSVRRRFVPPAKVIAVDCDGTLWRGVVGEDGVEGLGVGPDGPDRAFQLFQRRLRELKDRGVLIALVSRNEESDVWRVFDEHPGMILRREDIAAWRIRWQPKSQMLTELAAEMGLSSNAFVFIDDDRAIRMEVAANAPGVLVVPLSEEPADRSAALEALWCFDGVQPTAVDQARTRMLHEERDRLQVRHEATDMESYLRDLGLVVTVGAAADAELSRVAQLTQRTNQFNTSLRRRTLDEVRALSKEATVLTLSARDRFGEYGLVGVAIVEWGPSGDAAMETFLLSCRALGRGIEQTLLHAVGENARARGATVMRAAWVKGPRNDPARAFLLESGFAESEGGMLVALLDRGFDLPSHVVLERQSSARF